MVTWTKSHDLTNISFLQDDDLSQACSDGATPVLDNEWTLIYKAMRFHNEWVRVLHKGFGFCEKLCFNISLQYVWSSRTDPRGCVFVKRTRYWLVGGVAACANPCPVVCKKPLREQFAHTYLFGKILVFSSQQSLQPPLPAPQPLSLPLAQKKHLHPQEPAPSALRASLWQKMDNATKRLQTLTRQNNDRITQTVIIKESSFQAAAFAAGCDEGSVVLNNIDELKAALKALNINVRHLNEVHIQMLQYPILFVSTHGQMVSPGTPTGVGNTSSLALLTQSGAPREISFPINNPRTVLVLPNGSSTGTDATTNGSFTMGTCHPTVATSAL